MNPWVYFFVGTPKRFMWTATGIALALAMVFPVLAQRALFNVLNAFFGAVAPLEAPLLTLLIVAAGFWIMFRPLRRKKKGNNH